MIWRANCAEHEAETYINNLQHNDLRRAFVMGRPKRAPGRGVRELVGQGIVGIWEIPVSQLPESTESAKGEGQVAVLVTRDVNGQFEIHEATATPRWHGAFGRWSITEPTWVVEHLKDLVPRQILDRPGGHAGWPVEAALCLKLK